MKLTGQIKDFSIKKYYVTGSLEQKIENKALQNMLLKIKNGGMNAFLNDKELNRFAEGLKASFEADGYINSDNSLTSLGNDIVSSGKSWKGLEGAFFFTVLEYDGIPYLVDAELVGDKSLENGKSTKDLVDFQTTSPAIHFMEDKYVSVDSEFREIETDEKWAVCREQPKNCSVRFSFDYEDEICEINVKWKIGQKDKSCKFSTTEQSEFTIIKLNEALYLLEEKESDEGVFDYSMQDRKSIRFSLSDVSKLNNVTWISSFFKNGCLSFEGVLRDRVKGEGNIEDVHLYIDIEDSVTAELFLQEYLLQKAEIQYLGYEETGRLVTDFQNLFTSPDGKIPASPAIMKETKEIYNQLVERAKAISIENPVPNLHLQAYIDLSPADTIKPYIEKENTVNLSNQTLNFTELVKKVFEQERNIKSISAFSKYTSSNGRNARAFMLFAESVAQNYGVKSTLITTKEEVRSSVINAFRESDQKWFSKMKNSKHIHIIEKPVNEIKSIHDRYYKVIKNDGREEWWVMTGELDSLRFENDNPKIREDISIDEKGTVKEMTFAKIKKQGVPEIVKKLMEEN